MSLDFGNTHTVVCAEGSVPSGGDGHVQCLWNASWTTVNLKCRSLYFSHEKKRYKNCTSERLSDSLFFIFWKKYLRLLWNVTKNTPTYYSQIKEPFMYMFNIICLSVGLSLLSCYFNQKTLKFLCKWYSCKGVSCYTVWQIFIYRSI